VRPLVLEPIAAGLVVADDAQRDRCPTSPGSPPWCSASEAGPSRRQTLRKTADLLRKLCGDLERQQTRKKTSKSPLSVKQETKRNQPCAVRVEGVFRNRLLQSPSKQPTPGSGWPGTECAYQTIGSELYGSTMPPGASGFCNITTIFCGNRDCLFFTFSLPKTARVAPRTLRCPVVARRSFATSSAPFDVDVGFVTWPLYSAGTRNCGVRIYEVRVDPTLGATCMMSHITRFAMQDGISSSPMSAARSLRRLKPANSHSNEKASFPLFALFLLSRNAQTRGASEFSNEDRLP